MYDGYLAIYNFAPTQGGHLRISNSTVYDRHYEIATDTGHAHSSMRALSE